VLEASWPVDIVTQTAMVAFVGSVILLSCIVESDTRQADRVSYHVETQKPHD
jgi:hypothetical protein